MYRKLVSPPRAAREHRRRPGAPSDSGASRSGVGRDLAAFVVAGGDCRCPLEGSLGSATVADAETITLVSVIATGVVGVGAVASSVLIGWRDRVHTRSVRREDRRQERVEETYEVLVACLDKRIRISARIRPMMTYTNDPPPPTLTDEENERVHALVDLHASPEVDRLVKEFSETLRKIYKTEVLLRMNDDAAQKRASTLTRPTSAGRTGWSRRCSCRSPASRSYRTLRTGSGNR